MQNKKVNKASTDVKLTKAPDVKAEVKESVKDAAKKVETVAETTVKKAEAAAETTAKKVEEKAETVAKKAEAKAETATKKVEKAKTTVKKAAKKTVKEPAKTEFIVEFQGNAASVANLEDKVKAQFVAEGHRAGCIKTLNIYIKPEDYKAYYVINDKFTGSVDLF
ncbi:MAG: DUF6465 family protein [Lachnobacterium sp.]|nr:DUF6465 family protein [Lachnobacterium sp.]